MSVTIYVPCHNYGRYLDRAVASLLDQTYQDWQAILVDDGSTDDSWQAIERYAHHDRITALRNDTPRGLRTVANQCLDLASTRWVMRLDADDRLHTHCLETLVRTAEQDGDVGMAFSDYFYVDDFDNVLGVECLPTTASGYDALTFPPHGAGSLIRRDVLEELGRYDATLRRQDGHEIWLKLLQSPYRYVHVPLPLFYYRQHGESLSKDLTGLLEDRTAIMRRLAALQPDLEPVVGVIPVRNTYPDMPGIPFRTIGGRTLLAQAIHEAQAVPAIAEIAVTADSEDVIGYVEDEFPDVVALPRPPPLCDPGTPMARIVADVVNRRGYADDQVLCLLSVHTPRRTRRHIQKALDALSLYRADSVVTVVEERSLVYRLGQSGLEPINPSNEGKVRLEREALYVDTGAVRVLRARNLALGRILTGRIAHALMSPDDAVQIKSPGDFHLLDPPERAPHLTT